MRKAIKLVFVHFLPAERVRPKCLTKKCAKMLEMFLPVDRCRLKAITNQMSLTPCWTTENTYTYISPVDIWAHFPFRKQLLATFYLSRWIARHSPRAIISPPFPDVASTTGGCTAVRSPAPPRTHTPVPRTRARQRKRRLQFLRCRPSEDKWRKWSGSWCIWFGGLFSSEQWSVKVRSLRN